LADYGVEVYYLGTGESLLPPSEWAAEGNGIGPAPTVTLAASGFTLVGEGYCTTPGGAYLSYADSSSVLDENGCRASCEATPGCSGYYLSSTRCAVYSGDDAGLSGFSFKVRSGGSGPISTSTGTTAEGTGTAECYSHEPACAQFTSTQNAAISGHNREHLTDASVATCKSACCDRDWCNSFDYYKASSACDLSDAPPSTALKTNYNGHPYDHYAKDDASETA